MSIRFIGLILIVLVLAVSLSGCAEDSRSKRPGSTTFSDKSASAGAPEKEPSEPAPETAENVLPDSNTSTDSVDTPIRGTLPPASPSTTEENIRKETEEVAPLLVREEVRSSMPAYRIPEQLRTRLEEENPEMVPAHSSKFEVFNQHLNISTKTSTMTFTGVMRQAGKQDEVIELSCQFDKSKDPWECDQMYPVNAAVAQERRLQATVTCWDTHRCDQVAVELFVVIDGRTESQLFQKQEFSARRASSGDASDDSDHDEDEYGIRPLDKPVSLPSRPDSRAPRVLEKPTPSPAPAPSPAPTGRPSSPDSSARSTPPLSPLLTSSARPPRKPEQPTPPPRPAPRNLSDQELEEVINDPNAALEMTSALPVPRPARGQFSIPGVETLRTQIGTNVKVQAVGAHNGGVLRSGNELRPRGSGFVRRNRENRHFGTDLTIGLLNNALASVATTFPNRTPFLISNISKQGGGKLGQHASHQTGLDVDVAFPSSREVTDLWSACGGGGCSQSLSDRFDMDRFWHFTKSLACAEKNPVIAMFIDSHIKRHMCRWARNKGENLDSDSSCAHKTLKAMKHEDGHRDHVHIRFKCPGNRGCREATVSLGRGTGC